MVPRKQAGHMTCTRPPGKRQILLAMRASSTHDPKATKDPFVVNSWLCGRRTRPPKLSEKTQTQNVHPSSAGPFEECFCRHIEYRNIRVVRIFVAHPGNNFFGRR